MNIIVKIINKKPNKFRENIFRIIGKCTNKKCYNKSNEHIENEYQYCKRCYNLVCANCKSFYEKKCVICEIEVEEVGDLCNYCNKKIEVSMCYFCAKIMYSCERLCVNNNSWTIICGGSQCEKCDELYGSII